MLDDGDADEDDEQHQCHDGRPSDRGGAEGLGVDTVRHQVGSSGGATAIGRAAVMALVLSVILVGVTVVQHLYFRRRISYDLT